MNAPVSAIVLAAGASSRLGHPKAMIHLEGRPALRRLVESLVDAGVREGVVVVGPPHGDRLRRELDVAPLSWAVNPDPGAGRTGTLQTGWRAIAADRDVLLWPVDRPLAAVGTVRALLAAARPAGDLWVLRPVQGDRPGHPVLLSAGLRSRVEAAAPDANLRTILGAADVERRDVPAEDPGIHADLDTPGDVREAGGELP